MPDWCSRQIQKQTLFSLSGEYCRCAHVSFRQSVSCATRRELVAAAYIGPLVDSVFGLSSHLNARVRASITKIKESLFLAIVCILDFAGNQIKIVRPPAPSTAFLRFVFSLTITFTGISAANAGVFPVIGKPSVGWNGNYLTGRWAQVVVPIEASSVEGSTSVQLELSAVDSDGNRVQYRSPEVTLVAGQQGELVGFIKVGRLDGEVGVRVSPTQPEIRGIPGRSDWLEVPLKPSARLIVTVGEPRGFDFAAESEKFNSPVKVVSWKAEALPKNSLAYDCVSSLVLAGPLKLSTAQAEALRDWVASGGRLVISLSQDAVVAHDSVQPLADWLPINVSDQSVVVREFGGLESFAGKSIRIPQLGTLSIPALKMDVGEILAASRQDAFLLRAPYGLGAVSVLSMDLTASPMSNWKALSSFCARLSGLEPRSGNSEKSIAKGSQLSSTGITDLATQVHATQENFDRMQRASPWTVMSLLFGLLIVVGPIDYFFVHQVLKKPHMTWISYPCLIVCSGLGALWMSNGSNGDSRHVNQLDIVNVDVSTATARGRHFINLYSPSTSQITVAVDPLPLTKDSQANSTIRVIWQGVPETAFGGMLREKGLEQGATYEQQPNGQLTQLPVMQWSSKALVAESVQSAKGLIDSQLRASPTGRLTGTISHHLSDSIEDWMVVYKTVVYRYLKKKDDLQTLSFPPNQVWRVDQPSVHSRELRPYLTGIITMATPRFGGTSETAHKQSTYDPLSLDPLSLVRILTFHQEVGGESYTGLTNQILETEDCSHLLKLGRAILFGQLKQSVATIQENHKPLEPDRQSSFIRLILPVAQPAELMKELKRVVPD